MRIDSKAVLTITSLWLATLIGAYWLGGSREHSRPSTDKNTLAGDPAPTATGASPPPSIGGVGGARAGSLSPSPPGGADNFGSGAPGRLLHLLSGANGADIRRSEFEDIAENMSLDEVLEVVDQIAAMPPSPNQRDAYTEILSRWAQLDAGAALDHVGSISAPKLRYDATMTVLRHWASVDPAGAVAFVDSNPNDALPDGSLSSVFRGIGNSMDTTAALGFLASIENQDHKKYAYDAVRELFERNDTEVIEWTQSLPEGEIRDRSINALIDQWARYDPMAAKAWLAENSNDSNRAGALVELGESWARIDPESAAEWAMEMGDADSKGTREVLDRVFRRWMEFDIASAAGYLVKQEPSPGLDGALEQYIQRVKKVDPDATMAWAESISDPKRRRDAVLQVAKVLRSHDPQAYTSYIESSSVLTDKERDKLLGVRAKEQGGDKGKPKDKIKKEKKIK